MTVGKTTKRLERALIELEYLAADFLFDTEGQFADEHTRRVASYYQGACTALELCLEGIAQGNAERDKIELAA